VAAKLGVHVFSTTVYADFETAIHNAVTRVWPDCEVKACRFYLGQCWRRKIQFLGLIKQYGKKHSEIRQLLKKIFGKRKSATAWRWSLYPTFRTTSEWNSFAATC